MAEISFRGVSRWFSGGKTVVKNLNLDIADGEMFVLAGPENSGKATVLRMIAGTETISEGELVIDGEIAKPGVQKKRNVGMVFQNYQLYPGMTVKENLEFGMKLKGEYPEKIRSCVAHTAEVFRIENLLDCYPRELNDLQKQNVALARASVHQPIAYLVFDLLQRLSAAERAKARKRMKELHENIAGTLVYVTDSGREVLMLGCRTGIMHNGVLEQVGDPSEMLAEPKNLFVAQFLNEPGFCTALVKLRRTQTTVEAVNEDFGIDVPGTWVTRLEEKGWEGKQVLMGYSIHEIPEEEEEEHVLSPESDSRIYFFDPETEELI